MGEAVLIYGKSGSGKSRSIKFFPPESIYYINVEGKQLPFRQKLPYQTNLRDLPEKKIVPTIQTGLMKMHESGIKTAIIDDFGLIMTHIFMANHRNMQGNGQFEMYNNIADTMYFLIDFAKSKLPEDTIVYFMLHEDTDDYGNTKIKTIGKLLDQKCQMEAMVTICLRCMSDNGRHFFRTVTDGNDLTKAPEEMFAEEEIENDLRKVDETIREFYGWNNNTKED